jgi:tetrathionate reductase subunit B
MKAFVIDVSICNGCYCCQIACKDEHVGNDWSPYARPQPDTGHFWMKLNEFVEGTVPKVKMHYLPIMCMHCDNAPCMASCPVEGAIYKRADGLVIINPEKCTGCRNCVHACPYGAIYFNEGLNLAQKCTGCAHLLDEGWKEPRCVDACPTLALRFEDESAVADMLNKAEILNPQAKAKPRAYYLNIPGNFIAGTVVNTENKEVVIGAVCILTDKSSEEKFTTTTDGFGDFWFENLKAGTFSLSIEVKGKTKKTVLINAQSSVNMDTIALN